MAHWGLERDPFSEFDSTYVSLPSHDEAVARLSFAVETSKRWVVFAAPPGLGKTVVMRKARAETHSLRRRFVSVSCPHDGTLLFALLAERLDQRVGREPSRLGAWRALERGVRLASLQSIQIVIAVDDCDDKVDAVARRDLESLAHLGSTANAGLTIIQLEQTAGEPEIAARGAWSLAIGLEPLTRSQVETYLTTKLGRAGSAERIFTPRAITRLQALSLGVPRGLEQLASLCLIAGAIRGLEVIHADLVDAVGPECWPPSHAASR
jgi:type II secretory pathway predicted ATPase ExeA